VRPAAVAAGGVPHGFGGAGAGTPGALSLGPGDAPGDGGLAAATSDDGVWGAGGAAMSIPHRTQNRLFGWLL
jgi:hypothetical protein